MSLSTIDSYLEQIDELVRHAADYDDLEFRLRLEELVKKGGRDTENAIAHYITGTYVSIPTRLNLVRMAGYIRSTAFLVPLKKAIELGEDDLLREEAIISVSKYNDRRALDILVWALAIVKSEKIKNTIAQAITRIKQNNPLLLMLPHFLSGSHSKELFADTLKIFKKMLNPADAKSFIIYLSHADPLVAIGSFEILCENGNEAMVFFISEFFKERCLRHCQELNDRDNSEVLAQLVNALGQYLRRYPEFIPQFRSTIVDFNGFEDNSSAGKLLTTLFADIEGSVH
jgi:ribosomal protein S17E